MAPVNAQRMEIRDALGETLEASPQSRVVELGVSPPPHSYAMLSPALCTPGSTKLCRNGSKSVKSERHHGIVCLFVSAGPPSPTFTPFFFFFLNLLFPFFVSKM
ncbi:hypothetical protein NE237_029807 [Protea cynaroides]|uniref:Uncharacterized protein n=1 Tax=Protea cynaroides TaxID=273540 RepID=A0A9Q0GUY9_9MAGN|nr:hypothetical protein NE237_029807 [Protea cynaroides]